MIRANYSDRQTPQFRILSDAQINEIFMAALEILDRVGVLVHHPEGRALFAAAGARLDGELVRIPPHIIQDALASVPRSFTLWGRDGTYELQATPDKVHFGTGPTCTYFMDPYTGERRRSRRGDAALTARVCDWLPNIHYVMGLSLFDDVTPILAPVYEFAETIANTRKPIAAWANSPDTVEDIYKIALAVAGSPEALRRKPSFIFFGTYESPLRHPREGIGNMLKAIELGLPVVYLGGPTLGLESPFTAASGLAIHLATALSGVAVAQLKRRGAAIMIGGVPTTMDLRTARPPYGSPELSLHTAAACEIARYLGIPFMGTGGASEAKIVDTQAGAEAAVQVVFSCLSGASMVHDVGFLDCADIGSLQMVVLVDEIVGMAGRMMRGLEVNRETIMLDLIEQVGPGGSFLGEPRSANICRKETWVPSVMDRQPYHAWDELGQKSTSRRLDEKVQRILSIHEVTPLDESVHRQIDVILQEAEAREAGRPEEYLTRQIGE